MAVINGYPCHSRCGTLKNPHSQWPQRIDQNLQPFSGNGDVSIFLSETINPKQTNKQNKKCNLRQYTPCSCLDSCFRKVFSEDDPTSANVAPSV